MLFGKISANQKNPLFFHEFELVVRKRKSMFDGFRAGVDNVGRCLTAINVNRNSQTGIVSFGHCGFYFIFRVKENAVVRHQLDGVGTIINIASNRFANFIRGVGVDVFILPECALLGRKPG